MSNIIHLDDVLRRVDKDRPDEVPTVAPFIFPVALERLREEKRWCSWAWRLGNGGRWTKPPLRAMSDHNASSNNPATWDTLRAVITRAEEDVGRRGVGLMLKGLPMLGVIDLDKCVLETGEIAQWAEDIIQRCGSYAEVSPSRTGVKIFGFVKGRDTLSYSTGEKVLRNYELFLNTNRYVCITGEQVGEEKFLGDITAVFEELAGIKPAPESERRYDEVMADDKRRDLQEALKFLDHDDYHTWIRVGYALREFGDDGRALWDAWASQSTKYSERRQAEEWEAAKPHSLHHQSIFAWAEENGFVNDGSWWKSSRGVLKPVRLPLDMRVIRPVEYILDGQIPVGSLTIAGVRGGGKTTLLAGLTPIITGTCSPLHPMKPRVARKVIWVTEDVEQIIRIVAAMINEGLIADEAGFRDRFILVPARRSDPAELAKALEHLGSSEGRLINHYSGGQHDAAPLVLLDTVAATLEIKDENSNSDVSRAVAAVRQAITDASVWFVTHVAKGMGRADTIRDMTARGASAFESDVQGNAVLALEDDLPDKRFLILGKKRVDVDKNEITATRHRWETETSAVWGDRLERVSYATVEATDQEEREEAVVDAAAVRAEAAERARVALVQERCLAEATRGGSMVLRFARGPRPTEVPGYEGVRVVALDWLREEVCGIRSRHTDVKTAFKETLLELWGADGGETVFIRAPEFRGV